MAISYTWNGGQTLSKEDLDGSGAGQTYTMG